MVVIDVGWWRSGRTGSTPRAETGGDARAHAPLIGVRGSDADRREARLHGAACPLAPADGLPRLIAQARGEGLCGERLMGRRATIASWRTGRGPATRGVAAGACPAA